MRNPFFITTLLILASHIVAAAETDYLIQGANYLAGGNYSKKLYLKVLSTTMS